MFEADGARKLSVKLPSDNGEDTSFKPHCGFQNKREPDISPAGNAKRSLETRPVPQGWLWRCHQAWHALAADKEKVVLKCT